MKNYILIILIILSSTLFAQKLEVLTEQYPPFSYEKDKEIGGIATEKVKAVLKELNLESEIKVMRWSRAYRRALNSQNVILYSVGRTPEREDLFHWIGIVAPFDIYFYGLSKRNDITIKSINDLKEYRFGVVKDDMRDQFFSGKNGFKYNRYSGSKEMIEALNKGEIDIIPVAELNFPYLLEHLKLKENDYQRIYNFTELKQDGLYMVLSKKTSDNIVRQVQQAYDKVTN